MKKFFGFSSSYKFEVNDLRAIFTLVNIILILVFGASFAWIGLTVAALGLIKDFIYDRHINGIIIHLSNVILNIIFLIK